jgi:hypothetical protein
LYVPGLGGGCYSPGVRPDEIELWRDPDGPNPRVCVMISCCSGAELQLRRGDAIVLRELYPDKTTLYERAAELRVSQERESTS